MRDDQEFPFYTADMFASPADECDIVMKGGVTSGIVYPYAILELARRIGSARLAARPPARSPRRWQRQPSMRARCVVILVALSACNIIVTNYPSAWPLCFSPSLATAAYFGICYAPRAAAAR